MGQRGFTLLELSIVLVIIGLLAGGVTVGSSLIEQAEISKVHRQALELQTAVATFQLKYRALPGDMPNANAYWPTGCVDATSNPCNGDGDDYIEATVFGSIGSDRANEGIRAWQHLGLANVIPGSYNGSITPCFTSTGCTYFGGSATNIGMPATVRGGMFMIEGLKQNFVLTTTKYSPGGPYMFLPLAYKDGRGSVMSIGGGNSVFLLTPVEAAALDAKYDDGKPGYGIIWGVGMDAASPTPGCVNTTTRPNQSYRLEVNEPLCQYALWQRATTEYY